MADRYLASPRLMDVARYVYSIPWFFRRRFARPSYFTFAGRVHAYYSHPYNRTWMNERAVEIPLILDHIASFPPHDVLEVGNVLSHYFPVSHLIVDKYERAPGVIPADIVSVDLARRFSCIVSISTLEHIGWDEAPRVHGKHLQAIAKMRRLLSPEGRMFATMPLGHNPFLDEDLFAERLGCHQVSYFKRLGNTVWRESCRDEVRDSSYGRAYRTTDGLAFCVWRDTN